MHVGTCPNCGVELTNNPKADEMHKIQMATPTDDGMYCEACAFLAPNHGEYKQTGAEIVS